MTLDFSQDFIWGVATAAYQIEGAANQYGRGKSIWDTFSHQQGNVVNNENGDIACDHYHHYKEDIDLIAGLVPNYRFSTAWPRILPNGTGAENPEGIDFYNRLIDGLLEKGVTPWATMYHWDLPQPLQDKGGWENRDILGWFEEYAGTLMHHYGDRVKNWMILNEPSVVSYLGHAHGTFAPGIKDENAYWASVHHQNMVVGKTFRQLKSFNPDFNIGSTYTPVVVRLNGTDDQELKQLLECVWHYNYLDPLLTGKYPEIVTDKIAPFIQDGDENIVKTDLDFIGLQHYSPIYFEKDENIVLGAKFSTPPEGEPKSDIGWLIDPQAFTDILLELHRRYGKQPWMITENGIALHEELPENRQIEDTRRIDYLEKYLHALKNAMDQGVPMGGYFVWSVMDNMEWSNGYKDRFGLIFIDYKNGCKRYKKRSYEWYRNLVERHAGDKEEKQYGS